MSVKRERFAKRECPVCGGSRSKLLFQQRFEQLYVASTLDGYDVVICEDCGAGFADDIPPQSVFDDYYRDMSKYDDGKQDDKGLPEVEQRLRDLAVLVVKFIPTASARVFEIGCASGGLLKAIKELGYPNVLGSDPSPNCVRTALERYRIPGLVGTIFTVPAPPQPHDFLILTGVMEHIRDLDRAISRFHELLGEAGRIYLEVPDASRYAPSADAPFQEFSVEHINFFSQRSLINLMHARGFRALAVGHVIRPLNEAECPCTYAVFEKCDKPSAWNRDTETEAGLRAYIEGCQAKDAQICAIIREALSPGEKMIVWGVGTHTLRLLATGGLDPAKVSLFVDSNSKYQQQRLRGIPITSPEELASHREPILISSRSFQREIQNQIQNKMRLKNRLILLYES